MSEKIKIAVLGYGNLGRGVELAVRNSKDMELVAVFSRRDPIEVKTCGAPVFSVDQILSHKGKFDVLVLCGGSATDLPTQTPEFAQNFNKEIEMQIANFLLSNEDTLKVEGISLDLKNSDIEPKQPIIEF